LFFQRTPGIEKGKNRFPNPNPLLLRNRLGAKPLPFSFYKLATSIANIKILILDDKKLELLKKKDPLFYYALHFGSIILQGEENGI